MRRLASAALAWMLAGSCVGSSSRAAGLPPIATAPFDYYVMALSWSPGFCDLGGDRKSPRQCAAGAGYGFVVHGLWPDNRFGPDPEDCGSGADLSSADLAAAQGLYPTDSLAVYEYRKHGTCTGLDAADYFASVRTIRDQIVIPPALQGVRAWQRMAPEGIRQAFIDANANLRADNIALTCARGELVDVRICVSRNLRAFATCPQVAGKSCRRDSIAVAPPR
jgi:ribonuclease T2